MTSQANDPDEAKAKSQDSKKNKKNKKEPEDEENQFLPGGAETTSEASDQAEIDKLIGRGLKLPPVQSDGLW